ncbi:hypothetical protein HN51_049861 [Arachis hypogaea]
MLESLYLNDNQLIGEIPESIGSLSSLIVCNVSNNKLVGTVPDTPAFRKMDFSNFAGNNGLCRLGTYHCHPPVSSTHSAKTSWIRDGSTREKIVSIVYGVVGFVSLIFIVVICYAMRCVALLLSRLKGKLDLMSLITIIFRKKALHTRISWKPPEILQNQRL